MRTRTLPLATAVVGLAALLAGATPDAATAVVPAPASYAIHADHVVVDGGEVLADAVVVVEAGKVTSVVPAGAELDLPVLRHEGWLTAGLVAASGSFGVAGPVDDATAAFQPELLLAEAFDGDHSDVAAVRDGGVTSYLLLPGRFNVVGGIGAVVKTDGGRILRPKAALAMTFGPPAIRGNRFPTSYGGALREVGRRLQAGEGAYGAVRSGKLPVVIAVSGEHEARRALGFVQGAGLTAVLRGDAASFGEEGFAAQLAEAGVGVALAPLGVGSGERAYASVAALAEAGVPFAFGLADSAPDAEALRFSAVLCARAGIDRDVLWRALTSNGGRLAHVEERVGRVAAGQDADLALWSGDPLDATTRLEAVYVDGRLVHEGGDE